MAELALRHRRARPHFPPATAFLTLRATFAIVARPFVRKVAMLSTEFTRPMVKTIPWLKTIPWRIGRTRRFTGLRSAAPFSGRRIGATIRRSRGWSRRAFPGRYIRVFGRRRSVLRRGRSRPKGGGGEEDAE
jgi:hypothetical protein